MADALLYIILFVAGASQGVFLALMLLIWQKGNHQANTYLAALTFIFAISLVDHILDLSGISEQFIAIRVLLWPKEFFYGVLIYFYVRELTQPNQYHFLNKQWRHFIPAIIHVITAWSILLLSPERQLSILTEDNFEQFNIDLVYALLLGPVESSLAIVQIAIYLVLAFKLLRRHRNHIQQIFSDIEHINLIWLRNLLIGVSITYVIWIFALFTPDTGSQFELLLGFTIVVLIYVMAILGIMQPTIFTAKNLPKQSEYLQTTTQDTTSNNDVSQNQQKYKNSALTKEISDTLLTELTQYMEQHKPYLDNQLSLPQLADQLKLSSHYLSQIINEQLQQNFFDFVNHYRVEEAKARLTDKNNQKQNILSIAMDVGFNSKSAFYTAFKKFTNMTPSQFRQSIQ